MAIQLSVIIPCFNHGIYLPEALASIDNSPKRDQIEVIVVNDGSTDEYTKNYVSSLDPGKYVIINQKNLGLAKARNNGILRAQADYVLMLDADNFIEEVFINDFFDFVSTNKPFDALYGDARFFGEINRVQIQGRLDIYRLLKGNYIDACAIFKKEKLLKVGLYDDKMPFMGWEDWDLWLKLVFSNSKIVYKPKIYFNYRVLSVSMIRLHNNEAFEETKKYLSGKHLSSSENLDAIADFYSHQYIPVKKLLRILAIRILNKFRLRIAVLMNR